MRLACAVHPSATIYAPCERFGVFGGPVPVTIIRPDSSLPKRMRYFSGAVPPELRSSTVWPGAHLIRVDALTEVAPRVALAPFIVPGSRYRVVYRLLDERAG